MPRCAAVSRSFRAPLSTALVIALSLAGCPPVVDVPETDPKLNDVAQEWMALVRDAMAVQQAPTIDARTAFHVAATMYEAWAVYDGTASGYFTGDRLKADAPEATLENRHETLSHAVYGLLRARYDYLPQLGGAGQRAHGAFLQKMQAHGYYGANGRPIASEAQALGVRIARIVLDYAAGDGANEAGGYADTSGYAPANAPLYPEEPGTGDMDFPNNWQPVVPRGAAVAQYFLTPHWGAVKGFALGPYDPASPRFPAPDPPAFGTASEPTYVAEAVEVLRVSGSLDPHSGPGAELVNLSPRVRGIDTPGIVYDSRGHAVNPHTGRPYGDHIVPVGDYFRALAMYHDGATFETPPPWWLEVATDVLRGGGVVGKFPVNKPGRYHLEYDVKLYFAVTAAVHDAAVNCWDIKRRFDSCRPISQVRYLDEIGMLPVEEGFIEVIAEGDPLAGENGAYLGRFKVMAWAGPNRGVDWIPVAQWRPYQALDFSNPPFPAYNSGHTNMSRAAAEALTAITGDPYFPGGLGSVAVDRLRFEDDLSGPVVLQWATYRDLADEVAFARLCTGVHVRADLEHGRPTGASVGAMVVSRAIDYFAGRGEAVAK